MKKLFRHLGFLALAGALLASCATLVGPRQVELPLVRLQAGIDKRFPMQHRVLALFDLALTRPQLSLLPETGRVALAMDAVLTPPPLLGRQTWRGTLSLSGRLYIDAARNAVLMAEPRIDAFRIDGLDAATQAQLSKVAASLTQNIVADLTVYSFRPEDLQYAGVQFVPTSIVTNANALVVSVAPRAD